MSGSYFASSYVISENFNIVKRVYLKGILPIAFEIMLSSTNYKGSNPANNSHIKIRTF